MNALAGDAPLRFAPFIARPGDVLSRPRRFGFLDRLGAIPIADTELLQLSQHLPLVLRDHGAGCEVLAVVHSEWFRTCLCGGTADGYPLTCRWRSDPFRFVARIAASR